MVTMTYGATGRKTQIQERSSKYVYTRDSANRLLTVDNGVNKKDIAEY